MSQSAFAAALLNPDADLPAGLIDPQGRPAPKRFSVYRNNVAASLTSVLESGFPVIRRLVGEDFFGAVAVVFLRAHPPRTRQLMLYGGEFPQFLADFPPAAEFPYLADVARLEQAIRESYHAADAQPVAPETLGQLTEAALLGARLWFAPSLRLIRSPWPIHAIWRANAEAGPNPQPGPEDVVILRPEFDPRPHLLPNGGGCFLASLLADRTVAEALNEAGDTLDLLAVLTLLVQGHAITGLKP